ncbi:MAG: histidinol-phosphatase [Trueperaceae bacterium]|nr:histidinol-phosphatase [Trueperaceae bacterium]
MIDLHTHHHRCGHARGDLADYVAAGRARGLTTVGLSDHAPLWAQPEDHPVPRMHMARSAFAGYVAEARALQAAPAGDLEVLVGVEADYVEGAIEAYRSELARHPLDYVLGSVHYVDGCHVYDRTRFESGFDVAAFARRYLELVREAAASGLFDVLAHVDAWKGRAPTRWPDVADDLDRTVEAISAASVAVEVNTSGLRKCDEPFPSDAFLRRLVDAGVPITYGSDAHDPDEVGYAWDDVVARLRALGVTRLATFRGRERGFVPLEAVAEPV